MLSDLQKKTAQAVVNIFETGRVRGNYGSVTLLEGDTGHLTYGRSQTTLASGNLYLLINAYCETPGAEFATELRNYLTPLANRDTILDYNMDCRSCLSRAGDDPVMRDVQDQFFDRVYWDPCIKATDTLGISTALGTSVIYDSHIHGSWKMMRNATTTKHGSPKTSGENAWISNYVEERKGWLANHSNTLLRKTVYRMDTFRQLIDSGKWDLSLPLSVRGVEINEEVLLEGTAVRVSAHEATERILQLETPFMQGDDVKEVQQALNQANITVGVDGIFGRETAVAVIQFQTANGLTADGIVGPASRSALGL